MVSRFLCTIVTIFILATSATAKIWRIDNNAGNEADFTTLSAAHTGAAAGDTLYVAGSPSSYGSLAATKTLFIFGPGYFLSSNPETQANTRTAIAAFIEFRLGSNGSLITGMDIDNVEVELGVSNVTIKRNYLNYSSYPVISIHDNASNILILQNYIRTTYNFGDAIAIRIDPNVTSSFINNNYIEATGVVSGANAIQASNTSFLVVEHNVVRGDVIVYDTTFNNNILRESGLGGSNINASNNIGNSTQFGSFDSTKGNQNDVDMGTVFLGTGSTDGRWQLAPGSPAIGTGLGNVDIGMFDGLDPYVLSGIPVIPSIYFFSAPASGSNTVGIPVRLKVKAHELD